MERKSARIGALQRLPSLILLVSSPLSCSSSGTGSARLSPGRLPLIDGRLGPESESPHLAEKRGVGRAPAGACSVPPSGADFSNTAGLPHYRGLSVSRTGADCANDPGYF